MKPRVLLIRADASLAIGTGHVMRSLALAEAWQDAGGAAHLAAAELPNALTPTVLGRAVTVSEISASPGSPEDAVETVACAKRMGAQWIAIDGDRFTADFLKSVCASGIRILLIDDFANRESFPVRLIVNPNLEEGPSPYRARKSNAQVMMGPRFILLRREFGNSASKTDMRSDGKKILVTLGGSDPENLTPKIAEALARCEDFQIIVVAGPGYVRPNELEKFRARNLQFESNPPNMAQIMEKSDFAVIAAGGTLWELLSKGCAVLSYSRNIVQAKVVAELARRGAAIDLGETRHFDSKCLIDALKQLATSQPTRNRMTTLGQSLVDGRGASRVVCEMQRLEAE